MGFFDRILSGKVFSDNRSGSSALVAELELKGKKYIITELDWEFKQDLDRNNRPCSALYGGILSFTLDGQIDQTIYNWIINRGTLHSGRIRFYNNTNNLDEGAQMQIIFEDAICVRYYKQLSGNMPTTSLVISSRLLRVGDEIFEQNWK